MRFRGPGRDCARLPFTVLQITCRPEAGQGLVLAISKAGITSSSLCDVERHQRTAGRSDDPQVALFSKGDTFLDDDAEAGTIHLAHFGEIQQELARPLSGECLISTPQMLYSSSATISCGVFRVIAGNHITTAFATRSLT